METSLPTPICKGLCLFTRGYLELWKTHLKNCLPIPDRLFAGIDWPMTSCWRPCTRLFWLSLDDISDITEMHKVGITEICHHFFHLPAKTPPCLVGTWGKYGFLPAILGYQELEDSNWFANHGHAILCAGTDNYCNSICALGGLNDEL